MKEPICIGSGVAWWWYRVELAALHAICPTILRRERLPCSISARADEHLYCISRHSAGDRLRVEFPPLVAVELRLHRLRRALDLCAASDSEPFGGGDTSYRC